MLVAKIRYVPQNPVGMAQKMAYLMPSLRDFNLFVPVLATNIESRWDFKNRKPFSNKYNQLLMPNYNNKIFRSVTNTSNGEVGEETLFYYQQKDKVIWAEYSGGAIVKGFLIAKLLENDTLDMRYEHINQAGELMTGVCLSTPEILLNGLIRLHEKWQWTNGNFSSGESVIEEIIEKTS